MWTKQRTRQGDTLSKLSRDYGTTVEKIVAANGVCPPSQHTDRYLSQQAQAYMLSTNLPRPALSKLVLERDIQKWVRSIGGDCEDIREGSQTQTTRLMSCPPGHYCRFTSDTSVVLPARKRLATLAGLGAVNVMDTVAYLNSIKQWAKDFGDYVVNNANANEDNVDSWRDGFVVGMNGKITVATRADSSGVPAFVRDPSLIQKVADFATSKANEAKQFNKSLADRLSAMVADVQSGVASALRSVAAAVSPGTAPAPAAQTAAAPSAGSDILAPVRAGTATVKRGQKGAAVSAVQTLLSQKLPKAKIPSGFSVDGDFGARTETAVKNFQTSIGLAVNGAVDKSTLRALEGAVGVNAALAPSASIRTSGSTGGGAFIATNTALADVRSGKTLSRPQSGAGVREAQALLNAKGIRGSNGRALDVDSMFGPQTEGAVKAAQTRAGLPTSGILDRDTLLAIESDFARVGAPGVQAQTLGKDNTMLYVGVAAVALLAAAAVAKKRKRAA
jgi:peptidoglycan hydrolase-like protein with peptidoglycan-binding domain